MLHMVLVTVEVSQWHTHQHWSTYTGFWRKPLRKKYTDHSSIIISMENSKFDRVICYSNNLRRDKEVFRSLLKGNIKGYGNLLWFMDLLKGMIALPSFSREKTGSDFISQDMGKGGVICFTQKEIPMDCISWFDVHKPTITIELHT